MCSSHIALRKKKRRRKRGDEVDEVVVEMGNDDES